MDHVATRLGNVSELDDDEQQQLDRCKVLFQLEHARAALEQDNFYVALSKQISQTRKVNDCSDLMLVLLFCVFVYLYPRSYF